MAAWLRDGHEWRGPTPVRECDSAAGADMEVGVGRKGGRCCVGASDDYSRTLAVLGRCGEALSGAGEASAVDIT